MKRKLWCIGLLLLTILSVGAVFADQDHRKTEDALDKMMREGWKPVAPGVLQRRTGERRVETYAIGADGLRWAVQEMENRLRFLESQYQARPKGDLRRTINTYRQEIVKLRKDLEQAEVICDDEMLAEAFEKSGCSSSFATAANATNLTTNTQGVTATATAHFNNTCGWYVETHAEAYATATINGVVDYFSQTDGPKGTSSTTLSSSATAAIQGGPNCSSSAYSWVRSSEGEIFYSARDENSLCPVITGPSTVSFSSNACISVTWSLSNPGGTPPYSYSWSVNGEQVETETSYTYTRQVCPSDTNFNLAATVTDSTQIIEPDGTSTLQSATQTLAVSVVSPLVLDPIAGPTSILFTSPSAACESETWSVSASGGTTPYSYTWSVGGVQVGTGTSYTRQICRSHASFVLTASVTDSTSPQQSATREHAVTVNPVTLAPITGPTNVSFSSPTTANCVYKSWSTSASGGTSPYSYTWSINGTQVGTGTSHTRLVCPFQGSATLSVTATDSSAPQKSATQSQTVTGSIELALAINGPTSVSFTSSTAACESQTWNASASGGTSPYSYTWSIGGTEVGTGTSYTRPVCPLDADFTLSATATDSGLPSQSATQTRAVTVNPLKLAAITGPTSVSFTSSTAACQSQTWSASASGGASPYSYTWSIGGTQVGTGTSYTRQVCPSHANFTLTAAVRDSTTPTPKSDTRNRSVTISVTPPPPPPLTLAAISSPTSVSFTSSTAACVNRTWSTSASGGTTPYSYKWSVGGTQVGTGSSYTRQVCPSHANFTLTATVTDSTTPTAQSATRTQAVTIAVNPTPLSVSITGPTQAYFEAVACETYTWTASVSGGAPAYSYKWMVGTTQVGTGSSYSRSVCSHHADFTLSLTVTDSGVPTPQSKSATKTLTVSYEPTTCGGTRTNPLIICER